MSDTYKGECFCGEVAFEVSGTPVAEGYCHCNDCRSWSAAPFVALSLWPTGAVTFTKGEASVGSYAKTERSVRKFCTVCVGNLMIDQPGRNVIDVFPSQMKDFQRTPTMHVAYASKVMPVVDGLPKFADVPAEYGGSGDLLPE